MLIPLLVASLSIGVDAPTPGLSPATLLARDVAARLGPTVRLLRLTLAHTITDAEGVAVERALLATGLFDLSTGTADAEIEIRRDDERTMVAELTLRSAPDPVDVAVPWPSARDAAAASVEFRDEERLERLEAYRRERITVRPMLRALWRPPMVVGFGHVAGRRWVDGYYGAALDLTPSAELLQEGWVMVRGRAEILDELTFARLVGDPELVNHITKERGDRRNAWLLGFGGFGLAAAGGGLAMMAAARDDGRDGALRTLGASTVLLGLVSGVVALLAPGAADSHVLSPHDAEVHADRYNASLRRELGLSARDVAPFADPPER